MGDKRMRWDAILDRVGTGTCTGAEVGIWDGKTSARLLHDRPRLTLIMVDRWCPPDTADTYYHSGADMARRPNAEYRKALALAKDRVDRYGPRAVIMIAESVHAASKIPDGTLDFVFVDGDHSRAGCLRDIVAWWPKVKAGGWIGGHDYAHPDQGDVRGAVAEFFPVAPELDANRTWFVRRPA